MFGTTRRAPLSPIFAGPPSASADGGAAARSAAWSGPPDCHTAAASAFGNRSIGMGGFVPQREAEGRPHV